MNRTSSPGLSQWLFVTVLVGALIFLLYKLYQYSEFRDFYPAGLTVGGINVGGLTRQEAGESISNRYLQAPIILLHDQERVTMMPATDAEFTLDLEQMLSEADYQKDQQDFWAGFWGFLWGRPVEVDMIPLYATHNRKTLIDTLEILANQLDIPTQPPQPVPTTLTFQYGEPGRVTNISASLSNVENSLYRALDRQARLVVEKIEPQRPDKNLLARLIINHLEDFNGIASFFILDLQTGEEISYNSALPLTANSVINIPVAIETYRALDNLPTLEQTILLSQTLTADNDEAANQLLTLIAGQEDPYLGAEILTRSMQRLGLLNTFMAMPLGEEGRFTYKTPANSVEGLRVSPDSRMQTTTEDLGTYLSMIYYCAQGKGTLIALYPDLLSQAECQQALAYMQRNKIDSLLETGIPATTPIAHRQEWISDTHGDAGIVFSPAGDYIIVAFLYQTGWLEWELSSPIIADISRATYNYFNFDNPYFGN